MQFLLATHTGLARALFVLASIALIAATSLFVFEVFSRYIFDAPTAWSSEYVRYCLVAIIFCALPEITRQNGHIAIEIVPDMLPERAAHWLGPFNLLVATIVSGFASWIVLLEAIKQFDRGLMTNAAFPIPRYFLTALIALGLFGAATFFFRQIFEGEDTQ